MEVWEGCKPGAIGQILSAILSRYVDETPESERKKAHKRKGVRMKERVKLNCGLYPIWTHLSVPNLNRKMFYLFIESCL